MSLPFTKEDIIEVLGIHPLKIKSIIIYGSQVYGTAHEGSDYDIVVTASQMMTHEEKRVNVNGAKLNIHVYTPDVFLAALNKHDIMNLECIFAPSWAILQEKEVLSREIVVKRIIKNVLTQSQSSWFNGKMKIRDHNIEKGVKGIFHSMRMLMFASQIAEFGKITDFSVGNDLYKEMVECDEFEWSYYKEKYLPIKIELEEKLKSYAKDEK
jgi:predicted nucleotidyltransferase